MLFYEHIAVSPHGLRRCMRAALQEIPYSGSYYNECDYQDGDWRRSTWGDTTYAKLLQVKQDYDPTGVSEASILWISQQFARVGQNMHLGLISLRCRQEVNLFAPANFDVNASSLAVMKTIGS